MINPSTTTSPITIQSSTTSVVTTATAPYGGTLTVVINGSRSGPSSFDALAQNTASGTGAINPFTEWQGSRSDPSSFDTLAQNTASETFWINPFTEWLCCGDIEHFGPRGNGEFLFQNWEYVPEQYTTGELAQSWEISASPLQMTFHLRQGVTWTGNSTINIAARELIASDIVYSLNRAMSTPGQASYFSAVSNIVATDKYTVVISLKHFDSNWFNDFGGGFTSGAIQPQEMINTGASNWHNVFGTGPFILTNYISGSEVEYTRNPNYWGMTVLDGKQYQIPLIQTLDYPIIPDVSTQIAAVRTGKVDWDSNVSQTYEANLQISSPKLIMEEISQSTVAVLKINRQNSKTLSNLQVRRALMMAINFSVYNGEVGTGNYVGNETVSWPLGSQVPGYTAQTDLPESQAALYTFNSSEAKQMIIDAGYPNGFNLEIDVDSQAQQNLAYDVSSYWEQIGIKVSIKVLDATDMASALNQVTYPDMIFTEETVSNPLISLQMASSQSLGATYLSSEPFDSEYKAIMNETDPIKRTLLENNLSLAMLDDVGVIPGPQSYSLNCYWPWIKNYYGEVDAGFDNQMMMIKTLWIDQNVKNN